MKPCSLFKTYAGLLLLASAFHTAQAQTANTAYGTGVLPSNTGSYNSGFGYQALYTNTSGSGNTAVGYGALYYNSTGDTNAAFGYLSMTENTTGYANTGLGYAALANNTSGTNNVGVGFNALGGVTSGAVNLAVGVNSLASVSTDYGNIGLGHRCLTNLSSGSYNIGIGYTTGTTLTTGSSNIYIANNLGSATENGTIRIGDPSNQTATYVAGISGSTAASGVAVYVNSSGKLGTLTSSRRYKRDIADMAANSEAVLSLRPVAFRYKEEVDSTATPQFGLIAEEVEKVDPRLVAYNDKGEINTVRYEAVNSMMLNEFLKEHKRVQAQQEKIDGQDKKIGEMEQRMAEMSRLIERLSAKVD